MAQESWSLNAAPREVILPILMKMPNRELCRMRKTCTSMDAIARENEQKLSRRSMFFTRVSFTKGRLDRNVMFPANNRQETHHKPFTFNDLLIYKWQMAGISIHLMSIFGIKHPRTRAKMQQFFAELKPTVDALYLENLPTQDVTQLLSNVNLRTVCVVRKMFGPNAPSTTEFINEMAQSPFRSKIGLNIFGFLVKEEHFQLFKDFREIQFGYSFKPDNNIPLWIIQKLLTLKDVGHLKKVSLEWNPIKEEDLETILRSDTNNFRTFWTADMTKFNNAHSKIPLYISSLTMENNYMVIIPARGPRYTVDSVLVIFLSKDSDNKFLDIVEAMQDISPIVHQQMSEFRRNMERTKNESEQLEDFVSFLDDLVEKGGFFDTHPWFSNNVCFSRWH